MPSWQPMRSVVRRGAVPEPGRITFIRAGNATDLLWFWKNAKIRHLMLSPTYQPHLP